MPTNVDAGITQLPDGDEVHWSREEVTPDAAALFAEQAAGKNHWEGLA